MNQPASSAYFGDYHHPAMPTKKAHLDRTSDLALEVCKLTYRYPKQTEPIIGIESLSIQAGEQVVLTGHSGSGKSTLLHLLAGLMDPSSGTICVNGTLMNDLRGSRRDRFRGRNIGMVFQTYQLLHGFSVIENVMAALMFSDVPKGAHKARASSLLETLGINTPNAKIQELSIGQQQRVAVARAIACSPAMVLADEPTAALDRDHAQAAMDLMCSACRSIGSALVCVTHDETLIDRFDRHERLESLSLAPASDLSQGVS